MAEANSLKYQPFLRTARTRDFKAGAKSPRFSLCRKYFLSCRAGCLPGGGVLFEI